MYCAALGEQIGNEDALRVAQFYEKNDFGKAGRLVYTALTITLSPFLYHTHSLHFSMSLCSPLTLSITTPLSLFVSLFSVSLRLSLPPHLASFCLLFHSLYSHSSLYWIRFYSLCGHYTRALKLFIQCGDREIDAAIEVVGKSQSDGLAHQLIGQCESVLT